jgi:hypothetical protein
MAVGMPRQKESGGFFLTGHLDHQDFPALLVGITLKEFNMKLVTYNPVAGMLVPINNEVVDRALKAAQQQVGEAAWKGGYSDTRADGPTAVARLALEGICKPEGITGRISAVKLAATRDSRGNEYQKVRVRFEGVCEGDDGVMLSLDVQSELAQRLAHKLLNVQPGEVVTFLPFSQLVKRGDRFYANQALSLRNAQGKEVKAPDSLWAEAQALADAAAKVLAAAGISDRASLNKVKANKKVEYHHNLYRDLIGPKFENARSAQPLAA